MLFKRGLDLGDDVHNYVTWGKFRRCYLNIRSEGWRISLFEAVASI